jgi:hypothetical protein
VRSQLDNLLDVSPERFSPTRKPARALGSEARLEAPSVGELANVDQCSTHTFSTYLRVVIASRGTAMAYRVGDYPLLTEIRIDTASLAGNVSSKA